MPARTQLAVSSCNLYNLNEPNKSMHGRPGWSQAQYDKKLVWMEQLLKDLPSDVWGFQELWHQKSLKACFQKAGLAANYEFLIPNNHFGQRIVCAAAVKKNILVGQPEWIRDFPDEFQMSSGGDDAQTDGIAVQLDSFSRPVLHFEIKPRANGKRIHVYVCHLKSKLPTKIHKEPWYNQIDHARHRTAIGAAIATIRRTTEAAALRMILTNQMKQTDTPVVVLGDLNDGQHSNTLNIISEQPNFLFAGSRGGSDTALYTVGTLQEYRSLRDVYYTHIYKNTHESLDHIMVSQEFYDNSRKRLWSFKSMDLVNDHLNEDNHKQDGSSDHGIVRARFEYRPA